MQFDQLCMQLAIDKAWEFQALTYPNPAVGSLVTQRGKIIAIEAHQKAGTAHAEVLALLAAYEELSGETIEFDPFDANLAHAFLLQLPLGFFSDCTLYVTLEPCRHEGKTPSCASLLSKIKPESIVIAIVDPIPGHGGGAKILTTCGLTVSIGIKSKEAEALLAPFLIWQKRAFVLFKLAQTSNAKIGGGYLSSQASLRHVHQLREVCDRLVIGGNTVRTDRPTLDCRFSGGLAPDITIYSQQKQFDQTIPLFGIEGREVLYTDDLTFLEKPSFVLIEGGEGTLQALSKQIDWYLFYQTPKLSSDNLTYNIDKDLTFLHSDKKGIDMMIWSKERDE
ncbi:MAG: bifunctional diaminohydroxyphosphoribosylaminopyrimidine deaminase/5-amino-6-(5-phosphoribosylamino)uracil reductase RibD [Epsilonproteobacteria bacterium]|nr:MAG: bifunctional diaminohydroxyphosphoribosylaminopyrimidine deaminase/5-amino-6-(5-phosphoribosylamino)uracil reductase RibD [Campylobacterota bacterium]